MHQATAQEEGLFRHEIAIALPGYHRQGTATATTSGTSIRGTIDGKTTNTPKT